MAPSIILVRHGESEHNVKKQWAGSIDSRLTVHGSQQAKALGADLKNRKIYKIYASPLQRAANTAAAIASHHPGVDFIRTELIREKHLGPLEGQDFSRHVRASNPSHKRNMEKGAGETESQLKARCSLFLLEYIEPFVKLAAKDTAYEDSSLVIVSHGITLRFLTHLLMAHLAFHVTPEVHFTWANTGYTEIALPFLDSLCFIKSINSITHLDNLKRQKGGIGSSPLDSKQKGIQDFFSKH